MSNSEINGANFALEDASATLSRALVKSIPFAVGEMDKIVERAQEYGLESLLEITLGLLGASLLISEAMKPDSIEEHAIGMTGVMGIVAETLVPLVRKPSGE